MRRFLALALLVVVAGCSGSSSSAPQSDAQSSSAPAQSNVTFSLTIPSASVAATKRLPQFVSSGTLSASIVVTGPSGTSTVNVDLGMGSTICQTVSGGRSCSIPVTAPVGADTFKFTLYDVDCTGGPPCTISGGNALSASTTFNSTVTEGSANVTVPLALGGVPSTYAFSVIRQPLGNTVGTTGAVALTVYDHSGAIIVGPAPYTTSANATTGFTISTTNTSAYEMYLNGADAGTSLHTIQPSDTVTFYQKTNAIGAQLTVVPDVSLTTASLAWIRPVSLTSTNVEYSTPNGSSMQVTPLASAGDTEGVAILSNGTLFKGDGGVGTTQCAIGALGRTPDFAEALGSGWAGGGANGNTYMMTTGLPPSCGDNPQFPATTDVADDGGNGVVYLTLGCQAGYMFAGVNANLGSTISSCTKPHDIVAGGSHDFAVAYVNSSDSNDHLAMFGNSSFSPALHTDVNLTTPAGSIAGVAARVDAYFGWETSTKTILKVTRPVNALAGQAVIASTDMFVQNGSFGSIANSSRSIAIGGDGYAYVMISSPVNGVLVVDPDSGTVITTLTNPGSANAYAPYQITADKRGTIYWTAGAYLMHFPNNVP